METPHGKSSLVIGLGNPLSRDDAFGPMVLDRLAQEVGAPPPDADLLQADTDVLSHIDRFPEYARVILVDTVLDPDGKTGPPGAVVVLEEEIFLAWPETSPGVHQMSPLLAVKLFRKLHPRARTRIALVAYCTDRLRVGSRERDTLKEHIIDAGVRLVRSLLSSPAKKR
jgi:hydrogenase maturation protease